MKRVKTQFYTFGGADDAPFMLHDGTPFGPVTLAYEMYGELSPERDNAILLFHAFSGNQHAAGYNDSVPEARGLWLEECL